MAVANADRLLVSTSGKPIYGQTDGVGVIPDAGGSSLVHDGAVSIVNGDVGIALGHSQLCEVFEDFLGFFLIPDADDTIVNMVSPWCHDSEAGTSPVAARVASGEHGVYHLGQSLQSSETADITLFWGDELNINSNQEAILITRLQFLAQGLSTDSRAFGFIGTRGTDVDFDANNNNAIFKIDGANMNLLVESDDTSTDDDDNDTSVDLVAATYYEFMISTSAVHGASATDVRFFYRAILGGAWTRLLDTTTFAYGANAGMQPGFNAEKSTGVGVPAFYIDYIHAVWKRD